MKLGDYSAIITSNDSRLEEYQTSLSHSGRVATCWVASNEGQRFGVNCNLAAGRDTLRIRLLADGVLLDKRIADRMHHCCLSGNRLSSREKRPFEFARGVVPIEEFDVPSPPSSGSEAEEESPSLLERRQARDREMWSERGTITVEFYRVRVEYGQMPPPEEHKYYASSSTGLHTIKVGKTEQSHRLKLRNITRVEPLSAEDDQPFVTFKFKHRPRQWLEMYNIIPRSELDALAGLMLTGDGWATGGKGGEGAKGEEEEEVGRKRRRSPTPVYVKKLARLGMGEREELDLREDEGEEEEGEGEGEGEDLDELLRAGRSTDGEREEEEKMDEEAAEGGDVVNGNGNRGSVTRAQDGAEQPEDVDLDLDAAPSPSPSSSKLSVKVEPGTPHRSPTHHASHLSHAHGQNSNSHATPRSARKTVLERHMEAAARARAAAGLGEEEDRQAEEFLMHADAGDEDSARARAVPLFGQQQPAFEKEEPGKIFSWSAAHPGKVEEDEEGARDADGRSPSKRRRSGRGSLSAPPGIALFAPQPPGVKLEQEGEASTGAGLAGEGLGAGVVIFGQGVKKEERLAGDLGEGMEEGMKDAEDAEEMKGMNGKPLFDPVEVEIPPATTTAGGAAVFAGTGAGAGPSSELEAAEVEKGLVQDRQPSAEELQDPDSTTKFVEEANMDWS